jgi:hypothetical protein
MITVIGMILSLAIILAGLYYPYILLKILSGDKGFKEEYKSKTEFKKVFIPFYVWYRYIKKYYDELEDDKFFDEEHKNDMCNCDENHKCTCKK